MEKKVSNYQFDLVNGFSIRVESTSFSRAIHKYIEAFGPNSMILVKTIYNIHLNLKYD